LWKKFLLIYLLPIAHIALNFPELMYLTRGGIAVAPIIFVDDNLSPLSLTHAEQINPIPALFDRYTGVSGLGINSENQLFYVSTVPRILSKCSKIKDLVLQE
jgi:hypothetical protein